PLTRKLGSNAKPSIPWSCHAPTSSLMLSSREGDGSPGSLNHSLPVRSHTYRRPLFSKVIPTASGHGPERTVSVNPGGTVAAERLPSTIRPHAAATNHAIAATRLIRGMQASTPSLRRLAQIARRCRPFRSMNDICFAFLVILAVSFNNWQASSSLSYQRDQFLVAS